MKVWVLSLDSRHGVAIQLFGTQEMAQQELYKFVQNEWGRFQTDRYGCECPEDAEEAIRMYFEDQSESGENFYSLEDQEVSGAIPGIVIIDVADELDAKGMTADVQAATEAASSRIRFELDEFLPNMLEDHGVTFER